MAWVWVDLAAEAMNGLNTLSVSGVAEKVRFLKRCAAIRIIVTPSPGTHGLYKINLWDTTLNAVKLRVSVKFK